MKTETSKLLALLKEHFSLNELRELCFELQINFEELPNTHGTVTGVCIAMIQVLHRQGRLPELIVLCQKHRPNTTWPSPQKIDYQELNNLGSMIGNGIEQTAGSLSTILAALVQSGSINVSSTASIHDVQNRKAMLSLVHDFWIKGVLEQSLHGMAMITLGLAEQKDAVENRLWDIVVQPNDHSIQLLLKGTTIVELFADAQQSLLILGEPGSGKTSTLLELGRDLIKQAETDPLQPIPVIFSLASWSERYPSLDTWLIDELRVRYLIPDELAASWITNNALALLLDGLDEVQENLRVNCIDAINSFRQKHGFVSIVVCSRTADYEQISSRLQLRKAVEIQPLTNEQVDRYLTGNNGAFSGIRKTLEHDPVLRKMITSPLILSILVLSYQGISEEAFQSIPTVEARRKHLFEAYINQMFLRYGSDSAYDPNQTKRWLSWLANKMKEHNQSVFLLEGLQPSWLSSKKELRFYVVLSRLALGAILGFVIALGNLGFSYVFSLGGFYHFDPTYFLIAVLAGLFIFGPILIALDWTHFRQQLVKEENQIDLE